jgi:hypothetical protein
MKFNLLNKEKKMSENFSAATEIHGIDPWGVELRGIRTAAAHNESHKT